MKETASPYGSVTEIGSFIDLKLITLATLTINIYFQFPSLNLCEFYLQANMLMTFFMISSKLHKRVSPPHCDRW